MYIRYKNVKYYKMKCNINLIITVLKIPIERESCQIAIEEYLEVNMGDTLQ